MFFHANKSWIECFKQSKNLYKLMREQLSHYLTLSFGILLIVFRGLRTLSTLRDLMVSKLLPTELEVPLGSSLKPKKTQLQ